MAQLEDMGLRAAARDALVNDPNFFLDAEITEHLQAGPCERNEGRTGYR